MAKEFAGIDTRSEILRIVSQVSQVSAAAGPRRLTERKRTRAGAFG
jgi:hypothetical protein